MNAIDVSRRTRLKVIAVGTGRDGTLSLSEILRSAMAKAQPGIEVHHEYKTPAIYNKLAHWRRTGDRAHLMAIVEDFYAAPCEAVSGNGYAPILDLLADNGFSQLKIIHLKRRDKAAFIESFVVDATRQPEGYGGYVDDERCVLERITPVQYGEMSQDEWRRLDLRQKAAWYYDKTHALIDAGKRRFSAFIDVHTEELNDAETLARIGRFVTDQEIVATPALLNHRGFADALSDHQFIKLVAMSARFNPFRADDNGYILGHAADCLDRLVNMRLDGTYAGAFHVEGDDRDGAARDLAALEEFQRRIADAVERLRRSVPAASGSRGDSGAAEAVGEERAGPRPGILGRVLRRIVP